MVKLYVLYGGDVICRDIAQLNSGFPVKGEIELANSVFLIQHPQGLLMWDSGLPDSLTDIKGGMESWIFHLSMKKTLLSQLQELKLTPHDIDYFALSHIHNDHTGNAAYFKSSTLIMQEKEYIAAFEAEQKPYNYDDLKELKESKALRLNGDYDLFGDGTVRFISTPGHTAGHQSLMVHLKETGYVIISGDISYYQDNYEKRGIPTYNNSYEESLASIDKIEKLTKEYNAQLWIQHDKERSESLQHSPLWYQ